MKAIILAAGVGKRLHAMTHERPKCLIPVGGKTILSRMLAAFEESGVEGVTLVVGYRAEMIERELSVAPPPLPVTLVENPRYTEGAILSLHAARGSLADDVLVMDADVVFDPTLLVALLAGPASAFLCDTDHGFTGEEMILHGALSRVTSIDRGERPGEPVLGEAVGFLRLSAPDARRLLELCDTAVAAGRTGIEHEELYNDLLRERTIAAVPTAGRPWTEVDFPEDVRRAEERVLPAIAARG